MVGGRSSKTSPGQREGGQLAQLAESVKTISGFAMRRFICARAYPAANRDWPTSFRP